MVNNNTLANPGPGTYYNNYTSVVNSNPNCKIGSEKRKPFNINKNPGPGNYNIPSKMVEGP